MYGMTGFCIIETASTPLVNFGEATFTWNQNSLSKPAVSGMIFFHSRVAILQIVIRALGRYLLVGYWGSSGTNTQNRRLQVPNI